MKLAGICRVFKLEEVSENVQKGKFIFLLNVGKTKTEIHNSKHNLLMLKLLVKLKNN